MRLSFSDRDYAWTIDGDLFIGNNETESEGRLDEDSAIENRMLESVIMRRLMSRDGDWPSSSLAGSHCANLTDFAGLPVNDETAELIKARISSVLSAEGGAYYTDISIECYPDPLANSIFIIATVGAIDPDEDAGPVLVGLSYDLRDNKIVPRITNI